MKPKPIIKSEHYVVYFDYQLPDSTWKYNNTFDFFHEDKGKHDLAEKTFLKTQSHQYTNCRVTRVVYQ